MAVRIRRSRLEPTTNRPFVQSVRVRRAAVGCSLDSHLQDYEKPSPAVTPHQNFTDGTPTPEY